MPISKHFNLTWRVDVDKNAVTYFVCDRGSVLGREAVVCLQRDETSSST